MNECQMAGGAEAGSSNPVSGVAAVTLDRPLSADIHFNSIRSVLVNLKPDRNQSGLFPVSLMFPISFTLIG